MNIQGLVEKIDDNYPNIAFVVVQAIIHAVEREGWLRNPGEPIEPEDIRKGDRVRIEYDDGTATEFVASGDPAPAWDRKYFLLDRPKPELPTEPGSVVRGESGLIYVLDRDGFWRNGGYRLSPEEVADGFDWEVVC